MTPLPPDPYKVLGISKDAQIPDIRSAHRKLVLRCHPDKVQDPALKAQKQDEFQKVQQAYELLSDDRERQKYDDQIKLVELRKQFQTQANISTPRSSPKAFNIYTAEPPGPMGRSPPAAKVYTYSRSWDDEIGGGPQPFDAGTPRSSRREASYPERPSKRELERERERDRDAKDAKDRDKERDRRRKAEDARRAEKEAKEQRRSDKNKREKLRDKDFRREADEKRRYAKPYIESFDDEPPPSKLEKKKSSSGKKHEEKRDRSSGREEDLLSPLAPAPPGLQRAYTSAMDYAQSYIEASRAKKGLPPGLQRAKTYHPRNVQPPVPTPPPMTGPSSPFPTPDDDLRRPSAKPRRGSGEVPRLSRERPYQASSREPVEEPPVMNASPTSRHTAQFSKSTSAAPHTPISPPRREVPRTSSMPVDSAYPARPVPGITRAQTFTAFPEGMMRGRARSRMHGQIDEESDTEDVYERRARERDGKHRNSRRHRTPEPENISRYHVDGVRAKLQSTYTRRLEAEIDPPRYYATSAGIPVMESRPPVAGRESSYASAGMKFPKVKTSKAYGYDDVTYSNYREGYAAYV